MTKPPKPEKKRSFLVGLFIEFYKVCREEFVDWFIDTPKSIAKAPLLKQLYQWPFYLAISFLAILIAGIAIIFAIAAIPS